MSPVFVSVDVSDVQEKIGEKKLAGVPGLEPGNDGIKTRCLTNLATPQHLPCCVPQLRQRCMGGRFIHTAGHETLPCGWQSAKHVFALLPVGDAGKNTCAGAGQSGVTRLLSQPVQCLANIRKKPRDNRFAIIAEVSFRTRAKKGRYSTFGGMPCQLRIGENCGG